MGCARADAARGRDHWRCAATGCAALRALGASCWMRRAVRNRFDRIRSVPGVPGTDRPVCGDRAAVPCRPVTGPPERGPTTYVRVRHTLRRLRPVVKGAQRTGAETTRGSQVGRSWLARTPGPTKSAGGRSRAVRVTGPEHRAAGRAQPLARLLRPGPGIAPAASWPGRCPACPADRCTGPGSPSRARGSRAGRRRRCARAG